MDNNLINILKKFEINMINICRKDNFAKNTNKLSLANFLKQDKI